MAIHQVQYGNDRIRNPAIGQVIGRLDGTEARGGAGGIGQLLLEIESRAEIEYSDDQDHEQRKQDRQLDQLHAGFAAQRRM